jgi:hypothetical protein
MISSKRCACIFAISIVLILAGNLIPLQSAFSDDESLVLAKINPAGQADRIQLPVFAHLKGSDGVDYVLVIAPLSRIQSSNLSYQLLDSDAKPVDYLIATRLNKTLQSETPAIAGATPKILLNDGIQLVARATEQDADKFCDAGYEIAWFPETPIILGAISYASPKLPPSSEFAIDPVLEVQQMINDVAPSELLSYVGNLSGETAVAIGGESYTITTRHTASGIPITKATQYAYEFMQSLGLQVSYSSWTYSSYSGRNVIGTKTGASLPNEIVLITAHLDDMPSSGLAPGADDNASGSAAVLMAAEIMSRHLFQRTIRFVLFTGEEQGLRGSNAYAASASGAGDNIVAVLNLDMIAWNTINSSPVVQLHTRTTGNPSGYAADKAIADAFIDVISAYGLSSAISPVIRSDGISASDHYSFWNRGYAGILAIEDYGGDFCPYYHSSNDRLSNVNMDYYTSYVKAAVGTAAHLARMNKVPITDLDYEGDGKADISVWRADSGVWYTLASSNPGTWTATSWGLPGDIAVPADYDGDSKTDVAIWRPDTGVWYVLSSALPGTYTGTQWGMLGDKPFAADFDGDSKADIAVWRPSEGSWYVLLSGTPGSNTSRRWGLADDIPVPADYDHDGKTDIAVWRPSSGLWYVLLSGTAGSYTSTQWGLPSDKPAIGDYDGDGKTDIAVWRPGTSEWFVLRSSLPGTYTATQWGMPSDTPVVGDYDGDGKADIAVYRPGEGIWYILQSGSSGSYFSVQWGMTSDVPLSVLTPVLRAIP